MRTQIVSRLLTWGLVATLGLVLPACGDDDGGGGVDVVASDFEGYWRFDAVRLHATDPFICGEEASCEIRVTEDTEPFSLLGNVVVTAVDDTAMDLRARLLFLNEGLLTDTPEVMLSEVTLEPGARRWVIGDQDGEEVYAFERDGDTLTLTYDTGDPRNDPVEDGTLLEIEVTLATPPAGWSVADWRITETVLDGEPEELGTCEFIGEERFGVQEIFLEIDEDLMFEQRFVRQAYLDDACMVPTGPAEQEVSRGAILEGEDTLALHEIDPDGLRAGYLAFDVESRTEDTLVLVRSGCRPEAMGCLGNTPERVSLERVPQD